MSFSLDGSVCGAFEERLTLVSNVDDDKIRVNGELVVYCEWIFEYSNNNNAATTFDKI